MTKERSLHINFLQAALLLLAVVDLIFGLFFIFNLDSLSKSFHLIINQPEDLLWRQIIGIFFMVSFISAYPMLFAPMLYRHQLWIWNVVRPIGITLFLFFGSGQVAVAESGKSWIDQQSFFAVVFWIYLAMGMIHFILLYLSREEAKQARQKRLGIVE